MGEHRGGHYQISESGIPRVGAIVWLSIVKAKLLGVPGCGRHQNRRPWRRRRREEALYVNLGTLKR